MSNIKSPLGNRTFQSSGPQQQVFTVDDPTEPNIHPAYEQQQHPVYNRRVLPSEQEISQSQTPLKKHHEGMQRLTQEQADQIRQQRAAASSAVPKGVRERIEYLTGIGRIKDELLVEDENGKEVIFGLQSLKDGELEDIHEHMLNYRPSSEVKRNLEVRRQFLARSLWAIDGIRIRDLINSDEIEDKVELIRNLDENLVSMLQKFYEEKIMKVGNDKYGVKSEEDMQELSEQIKK